MYSRQLPSDHRDFESLNKLASDIVSAAGGWEALEHGVPPLFRQAIDEVIDAPRTDRLLLEETEKTEKTYLGTKIEIILRDFLGLPKGDVLDLKIRSTECDIKHTMGRSWSIPRENLGHPAILLRENEATALFDFGLVHIHREYMNKGTNQDGKGTISASAEDNILWILKDQPYPRNIWQFMDPEIREQILAAGKGTKRAAALFEIMIEQPVPRSAIEAMGKQKDPLKRIRRNGGARDILAPKAVAILYGSNDRELIQQLGLPVIRDDEFISYRPKNAEERALLQRLRHID